MPAQFAAAVVPRGVTGVVADPHEIANVAGVAGVRFMADASAGLPLDVTLMAPSCVPATDMATSGGAIDRGRPPRRCCRRRRRTGSAEVMNFPGVIARRRRRARQARRHAAAARSTATAPGVTGKALNAYVAAGIGSDHECVTPDEAREKLARGLYLLIREATNARNLDALLPLVTPANSRRICFCTDDRTPVDLLERGSVDDMVRRAIAFGIDPVEAIRMATLNPAEWFGLRDLGAIAPGRAANLFVFDDLRQPEARHGVQPAASSSRATAKLMADVARVAQTPRRRARDGPVRRGLGRACAGTCPAQSQRIRVIGSLPDQLVTEHRVLPAKVVGRPRRRRRRRATC